MKSIEGIRRETLQIQKTAQSTFFGAFPLARGFGLWPDTYEKFQVRDFFQRDEASRWGVFQALQQIAKSASPDRMHVLILAPGETLEQRQTNAFAQVVNAQSRPAFATAAGFTLHLGTLIPELKPQPHWEAPDPLFDPLCQELLKRLGPSDDARSVMVVLTRAFVDEESGGHWVQAQQRTYEVDTLEKAKDKPSALEADAVEVFESLARDRSRYVAPLMSLIVGLYIMSLIVHLSLSYFTHVSYHGWQRWLVIPSAGFITGFALSPLVILASTRWMPEPLSNFDNAAWWPCPCGVAGDCCLGGLFDVLNQEAIFM